jgi:hypothetical protein
MLNTYWTVGAGRSCPPRLPIEDCHMRPPENDPRTPEQYRRDLIDAERHRRDAWARKRLTPDDRPKDSIWCDLREADPPWQRGSPTWSTIRDGHAVRVEGMEPGEATFASHPEAFVRDQLMAPTWGDDLLLVTDAQTLEREQIYRAAAAAVAAGYRPPTTLPALRRRVEIAALVARRRARRGDDPRPALRQYLRRKHEFATAEFLDAIWRAVADLLRDSKTALRTQILRDREAGLSIREIARARGLSKSEVGRLSQKD